ncbi:MAG: ATP synthase F0 subunit B [Acidobacteria bacterium]|nr:ATP synthase F0 subunit B [Acidobacteriota bacterium]MBS1864535.1 ATP synthase F0 subunit B [Acidobacteriota bacterium]
MNLRRILLLTLSACTMLLVCASVVSAAEEASKTTEHATEIFKWINFAIVAIAFLWVFGKVLPTKFRANAETIGSAITKATAIKAEADKQLADAEVRLARLEQEVAELRAHAQKEAAADADRIREMAKSDAERISVAAKAEIDAAERAARIELKALAAKLAVDGAESLLAKQLTMQTQESLVSGFVKSLDGRPN